MDLNRSPKPADTTGTAISDDLLLSAGAIAEFIYGEDTPENRRNVYRNPFGFGFFKHGNTLAALKSQTRAELIEAQRAARERQKDPKPRLTPKPRRRLHARAAK